MSKHLYSILDSVTLTFDIELRVLYGTHLHIISDYIYQVSWIYNNNLSSYTTDKVWFTFWPLIVTLTFAIESWVLYATQLQTIVNIFTKCREDKTITCKIMAQTKYKLQKFDLWPLSVTLTFDTESWILYATHGYILKSTYTRHKKLWTRGHIHEYLHQYLSDLITHYIF